MPNYVPVSKEAHASRRWKRFESYAFANKETFLPLVAAELQRLSPPSPSPLSSRMRHSSR